MSSESSNSGPSNNGLYGTAFKGARENVGTLGDIEDVQRTRDATLKKLQTSGIDSITKKELINQLETSYRQFNDPNEKGYDIESFNNAIRSLDSQTNSVTGLESPLYQIRNFIEQRNKLLQDQPGLKQIRPNQNVGPNQSLLTPTLNPNSSGSLLTGGR